MTIESDAMAFFDACETGKGWAGTKQWCHENAGFACQSSALARVTTLEGYTEWMKGMYTPCPDARYELKGFAVDEARNLVLGFAVFHGTHTADGGPVPPTGKAVEADYVYAMQFDGGKIRHVTKIWNDGHSLAQLGWV